MVSLQQFPKRINGRRNIVKSGQIFHISPRKCLEILLVANANSIVSCKKEFPKTRKLFNLFVIKKL